MLEIVYCNLKICSSFKFNYCKKCAARTFNKLMCLCCCSQGFSCAENMYPHQPLPPGNDQNQIQESSDQDEKNEASEDQEGTSEVFSDQYTDAEEYSDQSITDAVSSDKSDDSIEYLELSAEMAKNVCKAAYHEFMRIAMRERSWLPGNPAEGFLPGDTVIREFRTRTPAGRKTEVSTASAIIPVPASQMASMMMDVNHWANLFFQIVYCGVGHDCSHVLQRMREDDNSIQHVVEITPNFYAIIDVAIYYVDPTSRTDSLRKPSGVAIREHDQDSCEIVWVENVEVDEVSENIYSSVINSNLAFCAQRWISTLLRNLQRKNGVLVHDGDLVVHDLGHYSVLALTQSMKRFFMRCVADTLDPAVLTDISEKKKLKILVNEESQGRYAYIGTTSFHLKAKPVSVFQFLKEWNVQLQLFRLQNSGVLDRLYHFVTIDRSNSITLHRTTGEHQYYCLQEATVDDYCSFIISRPMSEQKIQRHISSGVDSGFEAGMKPDVEASGFAIMPDGPGGLDSNGSLITFVMQLQYDPARPSVPSRFEIENDAFHEWVAIINDIKENITWMPVLHPGTYLTRPAQPKSPHKTKVKNAHLISAADSSRLSPYSLHSTTSLPYMHAPPLCTLLSRTAGIVQMTLRFLYETSLSLNPKRFVFSVSDYCICFAFAIALGFDNFLGLCSV
ncbi:homeobox-leucine zipper protein MERISTEM L1-like [Herrania umbratica]|uniref:Homeobox-leucine zipper protein MERISTEM L1-like n=1 Tax=Herrania umbratica TaxID=108875 RepID=A0A6J0ZYM4_9ROSI|nr:homeobox-leucine zipper protein MERISTEM L1-like [Herrania umbratica]